MHNDILIATIRFSKAPIYVGTLVLLQGDGLLILPLSVLFQYRGVDVTGSSLHLFFLIYNNSTVGIYSIFYRRLEGFCVLLK